MSMSMGGGDPYAALVQALLQRRQQQAQGGQQMAPQQAMGGTMQSQPVQMPQMAAQPGNAMAGAMAGMPSAQSLAGLLKQTQGGNGPSLWERFQGWGPDLGSRTAPPPGGQIQTYGVGQTPTGGGY
jgi:hypothetical protein